MVLHIKFIVIECYSAEALCTNIKLIKSLTFHVRRFNLNKSTLAVLKVYYKIEEHDAFAYKNNTHNSKIS